MMLLLQFPQRLAYRRLQLTNFNKFLRYVFMRLLYHLCEDASDGFSLREALVVAVLVCSSNAFCTGGCDIGGLLISTA